MDNVLKKIAAFLGIIQGLTWVILTIICISFYFAGIQDISPNNFIESVGYLMYYFYLDSATTLWMPPLSHIMTSHVFTAFMWVYLILNAIWLITSICIITTKKQRSQERALKAWAHCTLTISLWDIITVIILGADYEKCMNQESFVISSFLIEGACANVVLPVLVIAAKGFVLWIINIIFAVVLIKMAKKLKQDSDFDNTQPHANSFQDSAFDNIQQPRSLQSHQRELQPNGYEERPQATQGVPQNFHRNSSRSPSPYSPTYNNQYSRNLSRDEQYSPSALHPFSAPHSNKNKTEYPVPIPVPDYYPHQYQSSPAGRRY